MITRRVATNVSNFISWNFLNTLLFAIRLLIICRVKSKFSGNCFNTHLHRFSSFSMGNFSLKYLSFRCWFGQSSWTHLVAMRVCYDMCNIFILLWTSPVCKCHILKTPMLVLFYSLYVVECWLNSSGFKGDSTSLVSCLKTCLWCLAFFVVLLNPIMDEWMTKSDQV